MKKTILTDFHVDKEAKQIRVNRTFDAPRDLVWRAWTEKEILDQWWAPKPWKAETKTMDFRAGGRWLYCMAGPEGERHWCLADYQTIDPPSSFTYMDAFCDESGNMSNAMPRMQWQVAFEDRGASTAANIVISFKELSDLEKIVEMGIQEGFTAALENLDLWLSA